MNELLSEESGKVLADAYAAFCALLKQGELESVKRREFGNGWSVNQGPV